MTSDRPFATVHHTKPCIQPQRGQSQTRGSRDPSPSGRSVPAIAPAAEVRMQKMTNGDQLTCGSLQASRVTGEAEPQKNSREPVRRGNTPPAATRKLGTTGQGQDTFRSQQGSLIRQGPSPERGRQSARPTSMERTPNGSPNSENAQASPPPGRIRQPSSQNATVLSAQPTPRIMTGTNTMRSLGNLGEREARRRAWEKEMKNR